jgi:ubiquinone/menaquinone biosynthesis C-methylase UbiE
MTSHPHDHHHPADSVAELLDLDAEVLQQYWSEIMGWVHTRTAAHPVRRILDVGAGTGVGSVALANRFPNAEVVAADVSAQMLHRIRERAAADALGARVSTVQLDLDEPWPELGSFDLAWASASLHELAKPAGTFSGLFEVLSSGALLVVVEMDGPPRFLEAKVGNGLESRIHDVLGRVRAGANDHPDWTDNLQRAGFARVETARFPIDLPLEPRGLGGHYAHRYLRTIQPAVGDGLSAADRSMLDALVADNGPSSVLHRSDLHLRTGRTAWAARRP